MKDIKDNWGIVLLAAGASARLGKPKQSLEFNGKSLLEHAISTAKSSGAKRVVVVLGASGDDLTNTISKEEVEIIQNAEWQEGMASSIRNGLKALLSNEPDISASVFMVCDQPFVTPASLRELVENYVETGKPIIASAYGNSVGIPALFDTTMFRSLLALEGDHGAKKILIENPSLVTAIDFPGGNIDIDTEADYKALVGNDDQGGQML